MCHTDHREFISSGTSAGISAAFGAPIGGVLFAMEEACSFWSKKTGWRCFVAAIISTYTMAQLNHNAAHGMIGFTGVTQLENRDWMLQLPFIIFNAGGWVGKVAAAVGHTPCALQRLLLGVFRPWLLSTPFPTNRKDTQPQLLRLLSCILQPSFLRLLHRFLLIPRLFPTPQSLRSFVPALSHTLSHALCSGMAGLLGAGFNSLRMWLWKVRASKTRHVARILEVVGLVLLCQVCAFFFSWAAGKCIPKNPNWGEEYGMKFL